MCQLNSRTFHHLSTQWKENLKLNKIGKCKDAEIEIFKSFYSPRFGVSIIETGRKEDFYFFLLMKQGPRILLAFYKICHYIEL